MYLKGKPQTAIAEVVGVKQATVSRDLKAIRKMWLESTLMDFNEAKAREMARIDQLERVAWEAWENSLGENVTTTVKYGPKIVEPGEGDETSAVEEVGVLEIEAERKEKTIQLNGDPRYLERIQWCIEQRCKILGVYESVDLGDMTFTVKVKGEEEAEVDVAK
jgi:hypothetical protein